MKLNLGCGHNKIAGYVNVDASPVCAPDEVWDLDETPWPWADDSVSEALFVHSLEHMGATPKAFLDLMKELYRVMAPEGVVSIQVPHPRHDNFINDPTHVRVITPSVLSLFDRELNDEWRRLGAPNTPLAHYTGVNFKIISTETALDEPYKSLLRDGKLTVQQVNQAERSQLNVATQYRITLKAVK